MTTDTERPGNNPAPTIDRQDDEPPVIGAGCGLAPLPTERERWMAAYVARMVELGIEPDDAWWLCQSASDHLNYESDPRIAAEEDMVIWEDDGDPA